MEFEYEKDNIDRVPFEAAADDSEGSESAACRAKIYNNTIKYGIRRSVWNLNTKKTT